MITLVGDILFVVTILSIEGKRKKNKSWSTDQIMIMVKKAHSSIDRAHYPPLGISSEKSREWVRTRVARRAQRHAPCAMGHQPSVHVTTSKAARHCPAFPVLVD
ncbi:unnamed protein product, partial [Iphiclides podalirius]